VKGVVFDGMGPSNGSRYWTIVLSEFGHDVRLISPQFVMPNVKSNKTTPTRLVGRTCDSFR
jgi:transposase